MSDQICLNLNVGLRSLTQAAMVLVFMFKASWRLTIITFILIPLIILVCKVYGAYYRYGHLCSPQLQCCLPLSTSYHRMGRPVAVCSPHSCTLCNSLVDAPLMCCMTLISLPNLRRQSCMPYHAVHEVLMSVSRRESRLGCDTQGACEGGAE